MIWLSTKPLSVLGNFHLNQAVSDKWSPLGNFHLRGSDIWFFFPPVHPLEVLSSVVQGYLSCLLRLISLCYLSQPQAALADSLVTERGCRAASLPPPRALHTPIGEKWSHSSRAAQLQQWEAFEKGWKPGIISVASLDWNQKVRETQGWFSVSQLSHPKSKWKLKEKIKERRMKQIPSYNYKANYGRNKI